MFCGIHIYGRARIHLSFRVSYMSRLVCNSVLPALYRTLMASVSEQTNGPMRPANESNKPRPCARCTSTVVVTWTSWTRRATMCCRCAYPMRACCICASGADNIWTVCSECDPSISLPLPLPPSTTSCHPVAAITHQLLSGNDDACGAQLPQVACTLDCSYSLVACKSSFLHVVLVCCPDMCMWSYFSYTLLTCVFLQLS